MLATFNEYHWSFLTCGAQISNKTNTVGRSVVSRVNQMFTIQFMLTLCLVANMCNFVSFAHPSTV